MSIQQQNLINTREIYKKISKFVPEVEWKIHAPLIDKINKINWIWVDFFENYFLPKKDFLNFKKFKKKICLTSPDLVGKPKSEIKRYIKYLNSNSIKVDMVCVKQKNIGIWQKLYKY